MEENKKLDSLFEQARKAGPVVGFEEVATRFRADLSAQSFSAKGIDKKTSGNSTWIIGSIAGVIAIGAGAWFFTNREQPATLTASPETVISAPSANNPEPSSNSTTLNTNSQAPDNSSGQTENSISTSPEIVNTTEPADIPSGSVNSSANQAKSKEEEALFAAGSSKNAPPPPIYKKVEGYEKKSKTEVVTSDARVTSKTKVGNKKSINITNSKGSFTLNYLNGQLETLEKNSEEIGKTDWNKYADIIEQGNNKIAGSSVAPANSGANDFMQTMIREMAKDNLFDEGTKKVTLTKDALTINDAVQSPAVHTKYLELYKKVNGEDIGKNTVRFKR